MSSSATITSSTPGNPTTWAALSGEGKSFLAPVKLLNCHFPFFHTTDGEQLAYGAVRYGMHVLITQTNPATVDGEGEEGKRGNKTFPQDLAGLIETSSACHQTRHAAENVVICTRLAGRSESTSAVVFGCYSFSAIYNSNRSSFYSTFLSYSQAGRTEREIEKGGVHPWPCYTAPPTCAVHSMSY